MSEHILPALRPYNPDYEKYIPVPYALEAFHERQRAKENLKARVDNAARKQELALRVSTILASAGTHPANAHPDGPHPPCTCQTVNDSLTAAVAQAVSDPRIQEGEVFCVWTQLPDGSLRSCVVQK